MSQQQTPAPVAFITGGARRIGAEIADKLHQKGYRLLIHYRHSADEAKALADRLNQQRADTVKLVSADLNQQIQLETLTEKALQAFGQVDVLINNASSFYPTPIGKGTEAHWDDLFASNAKAPFFLSQALANELRQRQGCIINIADIHASKPLGQHTIYCMAKAANVMLTQSLAKELAPEVRVNGVAPGAILWPEQDAELTDNGKDSILRQVPLARAGHPGNIADTVVFLVDNDYISGQIIAIDGGRSLG